MITTNLSPPCTSVTQNPAMWVYYFHSGTILWSNDRCLHKYVID